MPAPTTREVELIIHDLSCPDCTQSILDAVAALPGVQAQSYRLLDSRLTVRYDPRAVDASKLQATIAGFGHQTTLAGEKVERTFWKRRRGHLLAGASGLAWLAATLLGRLGAPLLVVEALFLAGIVLGGALTVRKTWAALRARRADMNVLMTLAVAGAIALGEWSEGAMVIFLFALAELIESYSMNRAQRAVASLLTLAPDEVTWLDGETERRVSPERVPAGARIVVRPGERFGLDGVVEQGQSGVNQAPVTGESLPVVKAAGDEVFAGSINGEGVLVIRATRPASQSTLARIIGLVRDAQAAKAPAQRFIDAFARIYTLVVIALAAAIVAVPTLAFGQPFHEWFYRGLVVLLIGCPCALVISTPITLVSGLAAAARAGVLIKGGVALEKAARIRAVAFDKTGTLTHGQPAVVDVVALDGIDPQQLLRLAAAVEKHAGHVLAAAIVGRAQAADLAIPEARDVRLLPGLGATGLVEQRRVFVGNHHLFHERELCSRTLHEQATRLENGAGSLVFVGYDGAPQGVIVLEDPLREEAPHRLREVKDAGIAHLCMLTGDNEAVARLVSRRLPLDGLRAELLPAQKVAAVKELQARYGATAMVGDGVNDAPALAAADLGVAMGRGADQALETADVALLANDLGKLAFLFRLARRSMGRLRANIALALGIKLVFFLLALGGVATLWMAVFADMGASLLVIANGLRLLGERAE
ncbi:MAG: heavy metal translocating P-type ATPase [Myxococcales bacterium]|nr:heavy metal translocating P-type ATPase [Myxococcales bacterium]